MSKQNKKYLIMFDVSEKTGKMLESLARQHSMSVDNLCKKIILSYLKNKPMPLKTKIFDGTLLKTLKKIGGFRITFERSRK